MIGYIEYIGFKSGAVVSNRLKNYESCKVIETSYYSFISWGETFVWYVDSTDNRIAMNTNERIEIQSTEPFPERIIPFNMMKMELKCSQNIFILVVNVFIWNKVLISRIYCACVLAAKCIGNTTLFAQAELSEKCKYLGKFIKFMFIKLTVLHCWFNASIHLNLKKFRTR